MSAGQATSGDNLDHLTNQVAGQHLNGSDLILLLFLTQVAPNARFLLIAPARHQNVAHVAYKRGSFDWEDFPSFFISDLEVCLIVAHFDNSSCLIAILMAFPP